MLLANQEHRPAFAELTTRHTRWLLGLTSKLSGSTLDAEAIVQEVWLSVWNHRARYRPEGRFRAYLLVLVRNGVRNQARSRARRPTVAEELDTFGSDPKQLERLLDQEREHRLLEALQRLEPRMREALVLRYAEELAYDEMSRMLDTKPATLRARVHGALVLLRRHFTERPDK